MNWLTKKYLAVTKDLVQYKEALTYHGHVVQGTVYVRVPMCEYLSLLF